MKTRMRFVKCGSMKFIGHLDCMRFFQKAIRRAKLDVAYSKGYSPHQLMSFASPLGVGLTSDGEYIDVEFYSLPDLSLPDLVTYLNQFMRENLSKASPPRKKSKMIIEENEEFQNSPFPLNPQSKKSPNKLDLNKNNNYVEKNFPCAPVLSNVMVPRVH